MPETAKPTVAFLGLGKMGAAMAANVQKAGYPLVVWNRSPEKADVLVNGGATLADSPASAASQGAVVITSLADDASVRSTLSGPSGVLAGIRPGAVHIGTSTISPELADELAETHSGAKAHYVAGPVVGRVPAAEAARLLTFVSGDPQHIDACRPVVSAYAPTIIFTGERASQANIAKLIANFLGASAMDLIGQSLAFAEKAGLSQQLMLPLLSGFFGAQASKDYVTKIAERDFDAVGFTATGGLKDVELMIAAAGAAHLKLSSAEAIRTKLRTAITHGWGQRDWSCFTEIDRS